MTKRLFADYYGLQRLPDELAKARGEVGAWLVADELQLEKGYLSMELASARSWEAQSSAFRHIKRRPWLKGKMAVKPLPGRTRAAS